MPVPTRHPLAAYLARKKISPETFASEVGIGRSTLYRILDGCDTYLIVADKIVKATGGKVKLQQLADNVRR